MLTRPYTRFLCLVMYSGTYTYMSGQTEAQLAHMHALTHTIHTASEVHQPSMSRQTGEALARLWRRLWSSLMFSLMQGSLCQQPSIRSQTSLGQVRGRCRTRPWVMHSITYSAEQQQVSNTLTKHFSFLSVNLLVSTKYAQVQCLTWKAN